LEIITFILDTLRYIVPALVVYLLMRQYASQQANIELVKQRTAMSSGTTELRMQSYERLVLLVERIGLVDVLMRLDTPEITTQLLSNAMMVTIQKEYEHNLTQQIYVSGELWDMITLLKDESLAAVLDATNATDVNTKDDYKSQVYRLNDKIDKTFGRKVREGIRKEVELYFK